MNTLHNDDWDEDNPIIDVTLDGTPCREYVAHLVYLDPPTISLSSRIVLGGYVLSRETDGMPMTLTEARQLHTAMGAAIAQMERLTTLPLD
jgi:hypothetical protein